MISKVIHEALADMAEGLSLVYYCSDHKHHNDRNRKYIELEFDMTELYLIFILADYAVMKSRRPFSVIVELYKQLLQNVFIQIFQNLMDL